MANKFSSLQQTVHWVQNTESLEVGSRMLDSSTYIITTIITITITTWIYTAHINNTYTMHVIQVHPR